MHEEGFLINKKSGLVLDIRGGSIERDKVIIQYARKPGLAHNQRWTYKDGFIFPSTAPHLALDIRAGEYKSGNTVYLNTKNLHSSTQQWIIEPFHNEKSDEELALLRPSPLQRTSSFPRQEELYDCFRIVYLEAGHKYTVEQLAGGAAFKGMKEYIENRIKINNEPVIADDKTRRELIEHVQQTVLKTLNENEVRQNVNELVNGAVGVAEAYFSREYSVQ
ncbi:unnamed protein product [Mucor hiemalis]